MRYKDFFLKLIGYKKPSILQMIARRIEIFYDKLYGLDFLSVRKEEQLGLNKKLVSKASPSGNKYLKYLLNDIIISENDSIIDIGCAKGSALKYFARFKFNKVHGIELSKPLVKICNNNFKVLKIDKVKAFNSSALDFKKYENYNFFYLYNPFPEIVMKKLIQTLKEQINDKKITIIYNNPVCHDLLEEFGFFLIKTYPDMWGNGINLYSN